ncbi:MAG: hypothetical protein QOI20_3358 [Acidimicrobiaceae bacterium]|jgi:hypothetical protein|nr:hypothetical protein [Acidimicrobiaceae bacterium]
MKAAWALVLLALLAVPLAAADPPPDSPPPSDPSPSDPADNATAPPTAHATTIMVAGIVEINPFVQCALLVVGPTPTPPYVAQIDWDCLWRIIHVRP